MNASLSLAGQLIKQLNEVYNQDWGTSGNIPKLSQAVTMLPQNLQQWVHANQRKALELFQYNIEDGYRGKQLIQEWKNDILRQMS